LGVLSLPITSRLGRAEMTFRLGVAPDGFTVSDRSDFTVMVETLIDDDFAVDLGDPSVIVDAGGHAGLFTLYLHERFPHAQIVVIEPSPQNFARLTRNLNHLPQASLQMVALGPEASIGRFREGEQSWGSALHPDGTVSVSVTRLSELLERLGLPRIDLLKVDIEGAEWDAFLSPEDFCGATHVIGELHASPAKAHEFFERFPTYAATVFRTFPNSQLFHLAST
jgi:FkbM family methyltransferase